jgi:hypothetical protein
MKSTSRKARNKKYERKMKWKEKSEDKRIDEWKKRKKCTDGKELKNIEKKEYIYVYIAHKSCCYHICSNSASFVTNYAADPNVNGTKVGVRRHRITVCNMCDRSVNQSDYKNTAIEHEA